MAVRLTPLPHEWMLVSIIGFFVSIYHIYPFWSKSWGFTFGVFFVMIFFASMVSMAGAGLNEDDLIELAIHDDRVRRGEHRKEK